MPSIDYEAQIKLVPCSTHDSRYDSATTADLGLLHQQRLHDSICHSS